MTTQNWVKFYYSLLTMVLKKRFGVEILMVITLAIMGIYFFKSTDIPKELRERSAQKQSEINSMSNNFSSAPLKFTAPKSEVKMTSIDGSRDAKLAEMKSKRKLKEIQEIKEEIDLLTSTLVDLDVELATNAHKRLEIQSLIDDHFLSLQALQDKMASLS